MINKTFDNKKTTKYKILKKTKIKKNTCHNTPY